MLAFLYCDEFVKNSKSQYTPVCVEIEAKKPLRVPNKSVTKRIVMELLVL